MNSAIGLTIFAVGIVLLIAGFNATQSYVGELSRALSESPHRQAIWMIAGGALTVVLGLALAIQGRRRSE